MCPDYDQLIKSVFFWKSLVTNLWSKDKWDFKMFEFGFISEISCSWLWATGRSARWYGHWDRQWGQDQSCLSLRPSWNWKPVAKILPRPWAALIRSMRAVTTVIFSWIHYQWSLGCHWDRCSPPPNNGVDDLDIRESRWRLLVCTSTRSKTSMRRSICFNRP